MERTIPMSLVPSVFEQIDLTAGTAVHTLNSTTVAANPRYLYFSINSGNVRMRHDSTAPTDTTGVIMYKDAVYSFEGFSGASTLKFTLAATGTAAVIDLQAYTYPVD